MTRPLSLISLLAPVFVAAAALATHGCDPDCFDDCEPDRECERDEDCAGHGTTNPCDGAAFCTTYGSCDFKPLPPRTPCDHNGGTMCDGNHTCSECLDESDCQDGLCRATRCAPLTCGDEEHNGTETDVDCGNICGPCGEGAMCEDFFMDCQYPLLCSGNVCQ